MDGTWLVLREAPKASHDARVKGLSIWQLAETEPDMIFMTKICSKIVVF
jgi:hypothetical protein